MADTHPPDAPPLFRFQGRRSVVHSMRGIVACTSPLAGQAGLQILDAGGNAADAAVAAAAVLAVVDPSMTGLGGDVFGLWYDITTGNVQALNASGRTPQAATRAHVCQALGVPMGPNGPAHEEAAARTAIPPLSIHAVTVPGAAAGWVDTVQQWGSGAVTLAQVLEPAIRLADGGFPVGRVAAYYWAMTEETLRATSPESAAEVLLTDTSGMVRAPREGERIRLPALAATLRRLAADGKAGFYDGPVAAAIMAAAQARGSLLDRDDLRHHAAQPPDLVDALSLSLGPLAPGLRLWEHPPNGQGIVALLAAGIVRELERAGATPPLARLGHNSAAYLHVVIGALRIAFADAAWHVADPAGHPLPTAAALLDPAYLAGRAALLDLDHALGPLSHGMPALPDTSDTVYLAVTDEAGNGCSYVNSVSDRFGSSIVPAGTGFALQNRARMFRLGPAGHPNVYAGGKRAYNTIIPAILTEDVPGAVPEAPAHRLRTVFGVMGGFMQPQGHLQVLLNMEVFGMDPQTALDAPRVCIGADLFADPDPHDSSPRSQIVYVEEGMPADTVEGLRARGHNVRFLEGYARSLFGRGQVIRVDHDPVSGQPVYAAGSDGRGDGHAVPQL